MDIGITHLSLACVGLVLGWGCLSCGEAATYVPAVVRGDCAASLGHDADFLRGVVDDPAAAAAGGASIATIDLRAPTMSAFTREADGTCRFVLDQELVASQRQATGLTIINQISGTPAIFTLEPGYSAVGRANHFPLPAPGQPMTDWQDLFLRYAIAHDQAVGRHTIWIGTQEPSHTLGAPTSTAPEAMEAALDANLERFIDFWKPIAARIRAAGGTVGGIQMPSGSWERYQRAVDLLKAKDVHVDYLTFQLYRLGTPRSLDAAIAALHSYQERYPKTTLLIDRGLWLKQMRKDSDTKLKGDDAHDTSEGMIGFLSSELQIQAYSGDIYGYCIGKPGDSTNLTWQVLRWLNAAPTGRRLLEAMPNGVEGFMLADPQTCCLALWNTGAHAYELSVELARAPSPAVIQAQRGEGRAMTDISGTLAWQADRIDGIHLAPNQFVLARITSAKPDHAP